MIITTYTQLENILNEKCQEALDRTVDRLMTELERLIQVDVYDVPSAWDSVYNLRTGQFKDSWENTKAQIHDNIVEAEIFQNVSVMQRIDEPPIHVDKEGLTEIINSGVGYNFGQMEGKARPFWNDFIQYCEREFENIFQEELKKII
jgi:hypothetical protein